MLRLYYGPFVAAQKARIDAEAQALACNVPPESHVLLQFLPGTGTPAIAKDKRGYEIRQIPYCSFWGAVRDLAGVLKRESPPLLHCHTYRPALIGGLARLLAARRRTRMIYEIHGAIAFESYFRHHNSLDRYLRFPLLYILENLAIILSQRLLLVSDRLVRYYPLAAIKRRLAIPRLVGGENGGIAEKEKDTLPALRRFALAAREDNKRLLVYVGGESEWQLPEETVTVMDALIRRGPYRGVILTTQPDEFHRIVHSSPNTNEMDWFIDHVQHERIIPALRQCDYGILLREDIILNRVASPTKLYEYLYAGLALITTKGVPEGLDIIRELGVGVSVDLGRLHDAQYLDSLLPGLERAHHARAKLTDLKERFTFKAGAKPLLKLYEINQQV